MAPWTLRDVALAFILFLVGVTGGSVIIGVLLTPLLPDAALMIGMIVGYALLLLIIWYFVKAKRGAGLESLGFKRFNFAQSMGLVIVWFFITRIVNFIYEMVADLIGLQEPDDILTRIPEIFGADIYGFLLAFLIVGIVASVVEEVFFRGFIYPALRKYWGVTSAVIVNGILFGIVHFSLYLLFPISVIGIALAYLYEQTDSLGPPIMLHSLNNILSVVVIYYGQALLR